MADVIGGECYADLLPTGQMKLMLTNGYDLGWQLFEQTCLDIYNSAPGRVNCGNAGAITAYRRRGLAIEGRNSKPFF